ncbi:hypothetical protein [Rhizobium mayense]|uniref:Tail fiber domain-containing protein n=1 Tax=Rhizobium mayense TaxID=1312184 RepID=A0ABT7JZ28_9HYPH|nr:hypothetical protein [Rhizobium mayense]MDL2401575.1 hypothetical protein [Rhizobium mayense]
MPRNGSGVYALPPGSTFTPNTLIQSSVVNGINNDLTTDANTPRPIVAGGTGAPDVVTARTNLGVPWELIAANNFSAVATVDITNLSAYRRLRLTGTITPAVASAIGIQTSTNNGSSYDSGATDYLCQALNVSNSTVTAARFTTMVNGEIVEMTDDEIAALQAVQAVSSAPVIPEIVSARQFKLQLLAQGLLDQAMGFTSQQIDDFFTAAAKL